MFPIQKKTINQKKEYLDFEDICYMGTSVVSGSALAVVATTGTKTYLSTINEKVIQKRTKSSFERGVKKITLLLISFILAVIPMVLLIYIGREGE